MATYLVLNSIVLAGVSFLLWKRRVLKVDTVIIIVLAILLVTTAIFDSLIIYSGIVGYRPEMLTGLYIGLAPVEDFYYAVAAAIMVPALWKLTERNHAKITHSD